MIERDGLGTVREFGPHRYVLTGIRRYQGIRRETWTGIPPGMIAMDLGRRFYAAIVQEYQEEAVSQELDEAAEPAAEGASE